MKKDKIRKIKRQLKRIEKSILTAIEFNNDTSILESIRENYLEKYNSLIKKNVL